MAEIITGPIHNHTRRLTLGEIQEAVEDYIKAHGGPGKFPDVHPVHAAPAEDNTVLTKAVREWRQAPGQAAEFTQHLKGAMFWFGFKYRPKA